MLDVWISVMRNKGRVVSRSLQKGVPTICPQTESTHYCWAPEVVRPAQLHSVFPFIMLMMQSKASETCRWPQLKGSYPPRREGHAHRQTRTRCDQAGPRDRTLVRKRMHSPPTLIELCQTSDASPTTYPYKHTF